MFPSNAKKKRKRPLEFDMVEPMTLNAEISWERYALIAEIVERFHRANYRLGKTASPSALTAASNAAFSEPS